MKYLDFDVEIVNKKEVFRPAEEISAIVSMRNPIDKAVKVKKLEIRIIERWAQKVQGVFSPKENILQQVKLPADKDLVPNQEEKFQFTTTMPKSWKPKLDKPKKMKEWRICFVINYKVGLVSFDCFKEFHIPVIGAEKPTRIQTLFSNAGPTNTAQPHMIDPSKMTVADAWAAGYVFTISGAPDGSYKAGLQKDGKEVKFEKKDDKQGKTDKKEEPKEVDDWDWDTTFSKK